MLLAEHGRGARVAVIGPAGERRSLIAGIFNDRGRMAARSGLGAVMGAKRLKAVVLDGKLRIPVHDAEAMKRLSRSCNRWVRMQPPFLAGKGMAYLGAFMRVSRPVGLDGMLYKIFCASGARPARTQMSVEIGDALS
jgi:aldehyde:ferredoxin oxidoreductase